MNLFWPLLLLWSLVWGAREFYILYTQLAEPFNLFIFFVHVVVVIIAAFNLGE